MVKRKRSRRKTYRMKSPISNLKGAYGKMQSKHPLITGAVEAGALIGAGTAIVNSQGVSTPGVGPAMEKIPIVGRIFRNVYDVLRGAL